MSIQFMQDCGSEIYESAYLYKFPLTLFILDLSTAKRLRNREDRETYANELDEFVMVIVRG